MRMPFRIRHHSSTLPPEPKKVMILTSVLPPGRGGREAPGEGNIAPELEPSGGESAFSQLGQ
jgi:hypothetical protein